MDAYPDGSEPEPVPDAGPSEAIAAEAAWAWLSLPPDALLKQCRQSRFQGSGPGGQKRNRVYSGVRLSHAGSGLTGECVDSQGETEGLGVVLLEALNYARPIAASNVGGIPDIVRHGETGLLFPEKDPRALAAAVLELLRDPERAERLGRQGHAMVRREFSWEHVTAQWDAFYAEAAKRLR
jgi:hypothetical protein